MKTEIRIFALGIVGILQAPLLDGFGQSGSITTLLDPAFALRIDGFVSAVAVQSDGKILVAVDAAPNAFITRFDTNGSLDPTFDPGLGVINTSDCRYDSVSALATTEEAIFVGGRFTSFNGLRLTGIAKLGRDGAVDENFKPTLGRSSNGCGVSVRSIVAQADGEVLLIGDFDSVNGIKRDRIARLNPDGSVDPTFTFPVTIAPYYFELNCIAPQTDGKFILAGRFGAVSLINRHSIVRLNQDGSVDRGFNPAVVRADGLNGYIRSVTVQPDGNILIGGNFRFVNGLRRDGIARLHADGSLDTSFYPGVASDAYVSAIALQADGKVVAAGYGDWNGIGWANVFRFQGGLTLRSAGLAFTNYLVAENAGIANVTVERIGDTSGTITIDYFTSPGTAGAGVDYLEQNGTLSFAPGEAAKALTIPIFDDARVEDDEAIVVNLRNPSTGTLLGPRRSAILKILDDDRPGSVDAAFNPASGTTPGGEEIAQANPGGETWPIPFVVQPNGKIWVGGSYNFDLTYGGRLNQDGSLDSRLDFEPGLGPPTAIGVQSDGRPIVTFTGGLLQRINDDGSIDASYEPCEPCHLLSYRGVVQPDDKVILLSHCCDDSSPSLVRLNPNGGIDPSYKAPRIWYQDAHVRAMTLQQDGKLLVGGLFSTVGGVSRRKIARLLPDGALDGTFDPDIASNTNASIVCLEVLLVGNVFF
jgi:uncharacterized delta-60 repeat protein